MLSVAHLDVVAWSHLERAVTGHDRVRLVPVADVAGLSFDDDAIVSLAVTELRDSTDDVPTPTC